MASKDNSNIIERKTMKALPSRQSQRNYKRKDSLRSLGRQLAKHCFL